MRVVARPTTLLLLLAVGLAAFYYAAASEHARRVNTSKARGDQSGYLWDAQQVYWNWHGRTPVLIGERNRMPLYAAYLALFYQPEMSDDEYFVVAKRWNIRLSLTLLAGLAAIFWRRLPPLVAANLTAIVAFGYFVFKAGYAQSELLFYFLFFLTFLGCWELLRRPSGQGGVAVAAVTGGVAALAHLTKAAVLPLIAIFAAVCLGRAAAVHARGRSAAAAAAARDVAAPLVLVLMFLAVLSPYLVNSKRTFGHYFYNVNTTFYAWYDNWGQASVGTLRHGDGIGWPDLPADQIPSAAKYWRTHSIGQIAVRTAGGFQDLAIRSYRTYSYLPYVVWYSVMTLIAIAANRGAFRDVVRRHAALFLFCVLYAVTHLVLIAFYEPISGTGTTRFLIAHLTPFFFAVSCYLAQPRVAATPLTVGGIHLELRQLHVATALMLGLDLAFRTWPRVLSTYGGF